MEDEADTRAAERVVRAFCLAAIAGVLLFILAPGIAWLAAGAPSTPAAVQPDGRR
jgi:hypothetical protein